MLTTQYKQINNTAYHLHFPLERNSFWKFDKNARSIILR